MSEETSDEPNYLLWAVAVSVVGLLLVAVLLVVALYYLGFGL